MALDNPWLLPQGIEEALPDKARGLESLRRTLLDTFQSWGYEQVYTPFIEYVNAIPGEFGDDLDDQTFKLTDPISGQMLGVRADITPQVARIDAHRLPCDAPARLCYIGTVLQAHSDEFASSRSPIQVGCELYGDASVNADVEAIRLMHKTLSMANIEHLTLDFGHVGVLRAVLEHCQLSGVDERKLFDILDRKSMPELSGWIGENAISEEDAQLLNTLATLNGSVDILAQAREAFAVLGQPVLNAIDNLQNIVELVQAHIPQVSIHIDLSEAHGYHYKTGVVFAAYVPESGKALARGGRYDGIGEVFGRARPATGFSVHLTTLAQVGNWSVPRPERILAPNLTDSALNELIESLRVQGKAVVCGLGDVDVAQAQNLQCQNIIVQKNGQWIVSEI